MLLNQSILLNRNFLHEYSDIDEKLSNRINNLFSSGNYYKFNGLAAELKSKNYTYTRICRSLIHILLGIKDNDIKSADACRVLAFNKAGGKFLKDIRDKSGIKLICDLSEAKISLRKIQFSKRIFYHQTYTVWLISINIMKILRMNTVISPKSLILKAVDRCRNSSSTIDKS